MKIDFINGKVVADCLDWDNLPSSERDFFHKCEKRCVMWYRDEERHPAMFLSQTEHKLNTERLERMIAVAQDSYGVEVTDEVIAFLEKEKELALPEIQLANAMKTKAEVLKKLNDAINESQWRMANGCGICPFLSIKEGKEYCKACQEYCRKSDFEVEAELYAAREAKYYQPVYGTVEKVFHARPFPTYNCLFMVAGRKALELRSVADKN